MLESSGFQNLMHRFHAWLRLKPSSPFMVFVCSYFLKKSVHKADVVDSIELPALELHPMA
jgi:hypothetical protein